MRRILIVFLTAALLTGAASLARAELTSPQVDWQADLSTLFHNVSGTVTVLDDDTLQVDDFTYDGGGVSVYFYLGASESSGAFNSGLQIGSQLVGSVYDGTQPPLVLDLTGGETLEGWNAIAVWCVPFHATFGSGTFAPAALEGDYNGDGTIDAADYTVWRDALDAGSTLVNDPTPPLVDESDYDYWRAHYGDSSAAGATAGLSSSASLAVPEPAAAVLWLLAAIPTLSRPRRWQS